MTANDSVTKVIDNIELKNCPFCGGKTMLFDYEQNGGGLRITQVEFDKAVKLHHKWLNGEDGGMRADFTYTDMRGANLSRANLSGANLSGANLSGANLSEANLSGACLRWGDLSWADLSEANLHSADLRGTNLSGANLHRADMHGANLHRNNLSGANMREACLLGGDLSWANMRGVNLSGANLIGANLSGAYPIGANLSGANLRRSDLYGADLRRANLHGADMLGADMRGADMRSSDLTDTKIDYNIQEGLLEEIAEIVVNEPNKLDMEQWHSHDCNTVHCLAGWACHLNPVAKKLEKTHGTQIAALLTLGPETHSHFFDDNEKALKWLGTKVRKNNDR